MNIGLPFTSAMKREETYSFMSGIYAAISWTLLGYTSSPEFAKVSGKPIFYLLVLFIWLFCTFIIYGISLGLTIIASIVMDKVKIKTTEITTLKRETVKIAADEKIFIDYDVFSDMQSNNFLNILFIITTLFTAYPVEHIGRYFTGYEYLSCLLLLPVLVLIYTTYKGLFYVCSAIRLRKEGHIDFFDIKKFAEKQGELHTEEARRAFFRD